jgi:translin
MNLEEMGRRFAERFDDKMRAREQALAAARRSIRSSANAIRATHRGDLDRAHALMEESWEAVQGGLEACRDHPDVAFAGYLQDAQKEYSEARLTEAAVTGGDLPGPDELGVQLAPYLNGLAETVGEIRRHILDLLRAGAVEESERLLGAMDDIYSLLVTIDYPDAITGNLRRSTDVARSIMEKTRGDLSLALVQRDLREALDRHAREVLGKA